MFNIWEETDDFLLKNKIQKLIQKEENLIRPIIMENIGKVSKGLSKVHQNPYHIFVIC